MDFILTKSFRVYVILKFKKHFRCGSVLDVEFKSFLVISINSDRCRNTSAEL